MTIKANLDRRLTDIDDTIQDLERTAHQYAAGIGRENAFLSAFRTYGTIPQLTRRMLVELVREIRVHEKDNIQIELNLQDEHARLTEYLEMNRTVIENE